MLHIKTIDPVALGLLKNIQVNAHFSNTRLAGGTALALQIGHRTSIDLDIFGHVGLEPMEIQQELTSYGRVSVRSSTRRIQRLDISNIHVDIVDYGYPWLDNPLTLSGVRLASCRDIAAMKLAAVTNRGTRKDFVDIAFLLEHFTLPEMLAFYDRKFTDGSRFAVLKSLVYFADAEDDPLPNMLVPFNWKAAKKHITEAVVSISTTN